MATKTKLEGPPLKHTRAIQAALGDRKLSRSEQQKAIKPFVDALARLPISPDRFADHVPGWVIGQVKRQRHQLNQRTV